MVRRLTIERPLTDAEKGLLPPPLANAVDLSAVRIFRRWHTPLAAALKVTIVRGARIFWANAPAEAATLLARAHLAHELTHVWQYQALRRTGVELLASRRYRYRLDPARVFLSYGYEQQAAIVEDYVRLTGGGAARWARAQLAPVEAYKKLIEGAAMAPRRSRS